MTSAQELLRNWKILLLLGLLFLSLFSISFSGVLLGIDFKGGTHFQIHLEEKASQEQLNTIRQTIQQRLDWTGLRDTVVNVWGDEFIIAQTAETDPEKVERLEALLKKQGKFEVTLKEELVFTGEDIVQIVKDPGKGYGMREQEQGVMWFLPFVLKEEAARNFSRKVFHKCSVISYDPQQGKVYDCESTYFFIDRPTQSVIIIPRDFYNQDELLLQRGNHLENIPQETPIRELLQNINLPYFITDNNLTEQQITELTELAAENKFAILPPEIPDEIKQQLIALGYKLKEAPPLNTLYSDLLSAPLNQEEYLEVVPWVWQVSGARQIIMLSEDVTGMEPYVKNPEDARILSELQIRGYAQDIEDGQLKLDNLAILLESGSLPVGVESISKETISPYLGEDFLNNAVLMGIVALVVVSLVIFIRYRRIKLTVPLLITGFSEVVLILGFASVIKWNLDLAAVAGIVAVVGTGVDHQIIITDELIRGEAETIGSYISRIKRAFFIIMAAAATTICAMLPLILFGFGLGKLVGFAIITISGVIIGVFITRPAYAEMVKYILSK